MRKFILGTDWWTDCDDAVAIRLLAREHVKKEIELLKQDFDNSTLSKQKEIDNSIEPASKNEKNKQRKMHKRNIRICRF